MRPIDVINIAGLLMSGKNDGIENELRSQAAPRFLRTIAPTPKAAAMERPAVTIDRAVSMIRTALHDIEAAVGEPNVVLVGRSWGAFIGLLAAIRMNFHNISRAILIEGPLHPEVRVTAPPLLPPLMACRLHYNERPALARKGADRLKELGTSPLVIVQSGSDDGVVPQAAQVIPGDFDTLDVTDDGIPLQSCRHERGVVMRLPPHLGGSNSGLKAILPASYRNHLMWSSEKMAMIGKIIASAAG
jgi:pimeloyl-ACP methyl ester carboxylesterase